MSILDLASTDPATPDSTDNLSKPELINLATQVLDDRQLALWLILHNPVNTDGRTSLSGLCTQAGFTNIGTTASRIVAEMFGKLEKLGLSRARTFDVMCGFTAETVKAGLVTLMQSENERVAVKAHDITTKCLGMQQSGNNVSVNVGVVVQVPRAVAELVDRIVECEPDEDK